MFNNNNEDKNNKYYYLSLPSDATLGIKLPQLVKDELLKRASAEGVNASKLLKHLIIEYIVKNNIVNDWLHY